MKNLLLVRHAKSRWGDAGQADFDRPLNQRGLQNAPLMGSRLAIKGVSPNHIYASPVKRAIQTAILLAEELNFPIDHIDQNKHLYLADIQTMLGVIKNTTNDISQLLLVGHNPGITELSNYIADFYVDDFPTCAVHSILLNIGSWEQIGAGKGKSQFYDSPKNLSNG